MKKAFYSLLLIFLMTAFPLIIFKANAQTTTIFVDPASVQNEALIVGSTFTVRLNVSDVVNLFTWQTTLLFNSTVLSCENATYPAAGYIFQGLGQIPVSAVIDNSAGSVSFGASLLSTTASGSGIMAVIAFKVLSIGESPLAFSTPYGADTFLLDDVLNTIQATMSNGSFSNKGPPPVERHDVALTSLSVLPALVTQGKNVTITIGTLNNGTFTETFNIEVSVGASLIETLAVTSLEAGGNRDIVFTWNSSAVAVGSYIVTATAVGVPADADLTNNSKTAPLRVVPAGGANTDINGDGHVDMKDVGIVAAAFGTYEGHRRWNPSADINNDGMINLFDLAAVVKDFYKK